MKWSQAIGVFLFTLSQAFAFGKTVEVCPTCKIASIKQAIAAADSGDIILVQSGIYKENKILVDKSLSFRGKNRPVIDGQNGGEIFTVTASGFSIEGFKIINVGASHMEDRSAIRIKKATHFSIVGNEILNGYFAIYCAYAKHGIIIGNRIISNESVTEASSGNGIHLWYCKDICVEDNYVRGHRDGIYFEFADSSHIAGNFSEGNLRYGLHFMFSNHDEYLHNTFQKNGAGVAVMYSKKIRMNHNVFRENWGAASYGLLLKEISDAEIFQNHFVQNTIGVNLEGANRIHYLENEFMGNGWAIRVAGGCVDNVISKNNFVGNSFDLSMQGSGSGNNFNGNYWSDYAGYDLDQNGVGDVPYRPVKLFSYVVNQTPEAMVLLRSLFVDILNFSEKVSPVFTPENVLDKEPLMHKLP